MRRIQHLILILCLLCAGCGTLPSGKQAFAQQVLTALLPPDFEGDVDFKEKVPTWVDLRVQAGNVKRTPNGWTFDWFDYERNGPLLSSSHVRLGDRK